MTTHRVLTIAEIMTTSECYPDREHFARAIESAVLAKMSSAEPVGYFDQEYMGGPVLIYQVNYSHKDREGVFPLYLHPPAPSAVERPFIVMHPDDPMLRELDGVHVFVVRTIKPVAAARSEK